MLISLLYIVAVLAVAGVILYFLSKAPPGIDATIMWLIRFVIIIVCVVLVIYFLFGLIAGLGAGGFGQPFVR